jgi:hypothetical protein
MSAIKMANMSVAPQIASVRCGLSPKRLNHVEIT